MSSEKILKFSKKQELRHVQTQLDEIESSMLNIFTLLQTMQRQIVIMNSRIDKMDERLRSADLRETNRRIREYAIKKEPSRFVSTASELGMKDVLRE